MDSIARLRAEAAGTHRPGDHWPAHATPDYYARKRRPTLRQRVSRTVRTTFQNILGIGVLLSIAIMATSLLTA
ncbi:hypothetical protein [Actinorugispora endophytica]|uniref:Uncharacterized protein n=1 Tax=Actinorugispora endophytica TaxID=1605990 RepID=A0A4R6VDX9_9ACTN|nr:hypothetical protein [Actinorugispora endophytica]TDQ55227.1 hypothetical protein EV190_101552 [Actinorugispora endophytica]